MSIIAFSINELCICVCCGGDGVETCWSPDHANMYEGGSSGTGRLGCPCCGHSDDCKVDVDMSCDQCNGTGQVLLTEAKSFCKIYDVDEDYIESIGDSLKFHLGVKNIFDQISQSTAKSVAALEGLSNAMKSF